MAGQKAIVKEFLLNGAEGDIFCDLFSFEAPQDMEKLGTLFVVAELRGAPKLSWGVPNLITSAMRRTYFEKNDRKPAQAFTMALKEANNVLMHEISSGNEGWLGTSSFIAFILTEQNIFASRAGSKTVGIWLMRNGVKSDIFGSDTKGVAPFSSLVSGKIEADDIIFAGSVNSFSDTPNTTTDLTEIYRLVQKKMTERSASGALVINIPPKEITPNALTPLLASKVVTENLKPVVKVSDSILLGHKLIKWTSKLLLSKLSSVGRKIDNLSVLHKLVGRIKSNDYFIKYASKLIRSGINMRWIAAPKSVVVGLILISLGFGFIKTGTYAFNRIRNNDVKNEPAITSIEKELEGVRAAMIYGDKKQASELLTKAQENISLLQNNKNSASIIASLSSSWQEMHDQLFALKNVPTENVILLKGFPLPFKPDRLYLLAKTDGTEVLTLTDNEVGALYRFFIANKKGSIVLRSEKGGFIGVLKANDNYLYIIGRDGVTLYDETAETFTSTLPYENKENISFGVNTDKFALLGDIQNGQLLKISLDKETLKNGGGWLKKSDKSTLSKTLDAAWDGKSVWLLRNDGIISRYTNGVRSENITFSGTEKDFYADRIEIIPSTVTGQDSQLMILDSKAGKIIRFNSKGVLQEQYANNELVNATDFTISNDGKNIYILIDNLIKKIFLE